MDIKLIIVAVGIAVVAVAVCIVAYFVSKKNK